MSGLTEKLNHKFKIGVTDSETVMLDFDDTPFGDVKYWAFRAMKWFRLNGFMIQRSSENNYHVVFDQVSWSENVRIMAWVSLMSHKPRLLKSFLMQCIKQGSTLRVSRKGSKPSPRVVSRYGKQDSQIKEFLDFRKMVKNMMRSLNRKLNVEKVIKTT